MRRGIWYLVGLELTYLALSALGAYAHPTAGPLLPTGFILSHDPLDAWAGIAASDLSTALVMAALGVVHPALGYFCVACMSFRVGGRALASLTAALVPLPHALLSVARGQAFLAGALAGMVLREGQLAAGRDPERVWRYTVRGVVRTVVALALAFAVLAAVEVMAVRWWAG